MPATHFTKFITDCKRGNRQTGLLPAVWGWMEQNEGVGRHCLLLPDLGAKPADKEGIYSEEISCYLREWDKWCIYSLRNVSSQNHLSMLCKNITLSRCKRLCICWKCRLATIKGEVWRISTSLVKANWNSLYFSIKFKCQFLWKPGVVGC